MYDYEQELKNEMKQEECEMDSMKEDSEDKKSDYEKPETQEISKKSYLEEIKNKYKKEGKKIFIVTTTLSVDDETEVEYEFLFVKPNTASYDRYVKTASTSSSKALKTFIMDNIVHEQMTEIRDVLEEYPAMSISVGEKLLYMLGLSKDTTVKKL